ncbi:phasin family protein [Algihabitans albus]|uniref:phasin family protein n=1 Tax=Algihabitans albus TaxID=2164067 RepID=UPI0013C301CE|nr:phasin family protein [Algihabitans albus]
MAQAKKTQTANEMTAPIEAAVNAGKETVEAFVKAGTDAASQQYEQAMTSTKEQVEKASTMMFKGYDEFSTLNKGNMDAFVKSGTIVAKGFESLSKEMMGFAQEAMEANMAAAKKVFGAKNLQEMLDLQSGMARTNFDKVMAESAKLAELSAKVANEAVEPLQACMQATFEKASKPIAA